MVNVVVVETKGKSKQDIDRLLQSDIE